mmetsp:Transcript_20946/g.18579  ORF Transcript_20946/g.18579 Transcript_20946/m.18579 type:complete len:168 (-) Transcript_20946:1435-1938(-)
MTMGDFTNNSLTNWETITSSYSIQSAIPTVAAFTFGAQTMSSGVTVTGEDLSSSFGSYTETKTVALWNDDFTKTVRASKEIQLEFEWSCSFSTNVTAITFTLIDIESTARPNWVSMNASNYVSLNSTPSITSVTQYKFGIQTDYGSETYIKNFYITVEPCLIDNCDT